jgi:DegV family protein with EDD domain
MSYRIITDSGCDLPAHLLAQLSIDVIPLTLLFRGQEWNDTTDEGLKTIYNGLRNGDAASTSAINPGGWSAAMEPVLASGDDVLVLTFSSGLSTTYQSAVIAAQELAEAYPQRKIRVVDTLCASLGQGLLVWLCAQEKKAGKSLDEVE